MLLLLLAACTCTDPAPAGPPDHYSGFWGLVAAAADGDRGAAVRACDDVKAEDVDDERVGAALAIVRTATDTEELADGVAGVAVACGECHAGRVGLEKRPDWSASPEGWAIWGLIWNDGSAPPADPATDRLAAAFLDANADDSDPPADAGAARLLVEVAGD